MATSAQRRGWLYTSTIVVAGLLVFLGFGVTVAPDLGTRLSGAGLLAAAGSYDDALAEIDRGIQEHPELLDGYVFRAAILAQAGKFDESLAAYTAALAHEEATGDIRRSLIQDRSSVLLALGRAEEAQAARDDLARDDVDRYVHAIDAILAESKKEWGAAVDSWEKAHALVPDGSLTNYLWRALVSQGQAAVAGGRLEEAERVFTRAGELIPGESRTFLQGAEIRLAENDPAGAMVALRACPDGAAGVAPLMFRCATEHMRKKETEKAWAALEQALDADRDSTTVLLDQEPAWERDRNSDRMKALLATPSQ